MYFTTYYHMWSCPWKSHLTDCSTYYLYTCLFIYTPRHSYLPYPWMSFLIVSNLFLSFILSSHPWSIPNFHIHSVAAPGALKCFSISSLQVLVLVIFLNFYFFSYAFKNLISMQKSGHPHQTAEGTQRQAEGLENLVMHFSMVEKNEPGTSSALPVSNTVINSHKDSLFPP